MALAMPSLIYAQPAHAQLAIDRLWVDFDSKGVPRSDLVVRNESKDRYYVTVSTFEITDAGTDKEQRVTIADPEKLGLLVTPNRLILDPGQMRAIRLVSLNSALTSDRVYRVSVIPQIGDLALEDTAPDSRGLAIKLLAAFDVLVTVRPDAQQRALVARRAGNMVTLANEGNSNILLLDGAICPAPGAVLAPSTQDFIYKIEVERAELAKVKVTPEQQAAAALAGKAVVPDAVRRSFAIDDCVGLPGRRLYAGNSWPLPVAEGESMKFSRRDAASKDLAPIVIRCDAAGNDGSKDSSLCQGPSLEKTSEAGPALTSANQGA